MLTAEVIAEENGSPFASPIVMIKNEITRGVFVSI